MPIRSRLSIEKSDERFAVEVGPPCSSANAWMQAASALITLLGVVAVARPFVLAVLSPHEGCTGASRDGGDMALRCVLLLGFVVLVLRLSINGLWALGGREAYIIEDRILTIRTSWFGAGCVRSFPIAEVSNIRWHDRIGPSGRNGKTRVLARTLVLDINGSPTMTTMSLSRAEATELVATLQDELELHRRTSARTYRT